MVREDVDFNASEVARQAGHRAFCAPVVRSVLCAVDNVAVVVSCAVSPAVTQEFWSSEIGADLLRRGPEVVD